MAAETSWHRYCTKLRQCGPMYTWPDFVTDCSHSPTCLAVLATCKGLNLTPIFDIIFSDDRLHNRIIFSLDGKLNFETLIIGIFGGCNRFLLSSLYVFFIATLYFSYARSILYFTFCTVAIPTAFKCLHVRLLRVFFKKYWNTPNKLCYYNE